MFCAHCGAANDDNAFKCTACGRVLPRPLQQQAGVAGLGPANAHLAQSILVTIFCCQIGGIIAIVYSALAMGKNGEGDFAAAHRYARTANTWGWVSFGIGLVIVIFYIIAVALNGWTPP